MTHVRPPDDPGMLLLAAVATGTPLVTAGGVLRVAVPGVDPQPVPAEVLADVEARGWLDLSGDQPAVTERGHYWCRRWAEAHHKRHRRRAG